MTTLLGWIVRLVLGGIIALNMPAFMGQEWFLVVVLINAFGLHALSMAFAEHEITPRIMVPYAVLLAVVVLGTGTVAYALPAPGCQTCLDNGNGFWYCVAIYGFYCW